MGKVNGCYRPTVENILFMGLDNNAGYAGSVINVL